MMPSFKMLGSLVLLFMTAGSAFSTDKLIALTFDDGPRPYVLYGSKGDHPTPGLVKVLDANGVKATFFVVGWRLTPKTWGERRHEENVGISCIDAAELLVRDGNELEDHTYSHIELRSAERKRGEQWVLADVNRGAEAIKAVTGTQPRYVRTPDWIVPEDARRDLERQGYRLLTISRDQREKQGVYAHILAFHELSTTVAAMPGLISSLKARGYRFVTLTEYMNLVAPKP